MKTALLSLLFLPQVLLADGLFRGRDGRVNVVHVRGRVDVSPLLGGRGPAVGEFAYGGRYCAPRERVIYYILPQQYQMPYGYEREREFGGFPFQQSINVYGGGCNGGAPAAFQGATGYSPSPQYMPQIPYGSNGNGSR